MESKIWKVTQLKTLIPKSWLTSWSDTILYCLKIVCTEQRRKFNAKSIVTKGLPLKLHFKLDF